MKKILVLVLTVIFLASFATVFHGEEELQGTDITESVTMKFNIGEGKSAQLRDRDLQTACSARDRFELDIASETPIYGIYLLWNSDTPQWKLTGENETVLGGSKGFRHEYLPLTGGTTYQLTWEGPSDAQLAEIYFLSQGEVPDFVQVWDAPCEKADMLLFPTQAGDELLYFGGTIPYYAIEKDYNVQIAYLLQNDAQRQHELLNGLWHAGITNYPIISEFTAQKTESIDQAKTVYSEDAVLNFLVENIRRFKPEVVIGHDLNGEGGDGARMLNAEALSQRALAAAKDATQCPESASLHGTWDVKKCYLHLYQENDLFIDWSTKNLTVAEGKNAYAIAQTAYGYHISLQDKGPMSLNDPAKYGNGLFGLYSSAVGEDVLKIDFFENIPPESLSDWVEPEPEQEPEIPTTEEEPITQTQDITISTPEISIPQQKPTEKSVIPFWLLCVIIVAGGASLIGTIVLIAKSGKRK